MKTRSGSSLIRRGFPPTGYSIVQNFQAGLMSLLMPTPNRNTRYLAGKWLSRQLELEMPNPYAQVRVLGWIKHP